MESSSTILFLLFLLHISRNNIANVDSTINTITIVESFDCNDYIDIIDLLNGNSSPNILLDNISKLNNYQKMQFFCLKVIILSRIKILCVPMSKN